MSYRPLSGILLHPTAELETEVDRTNSVIVSLGLDVLAAGNPRLQADYNEFVTRWNTWKAPLGSWFTSDGWLASAMSELGQFKAEYRLFWDRTKALGFTPTMSLPVDAPTPVAQIGAALGSLSSVSVLVAVAVIGYLTIKYIPMYLDQKGSRSK